MESGERALTNIVFLMIVSAIAIGLQITTMGFLISPSYKPDLMLIVVVWAGLRVSFAVGMTCIFTAGLFADLFSGSPTGLFALIYSFIFVIGAYVHSAVRIDSPDGRAVIVLAGSSMAGSAALIVRWISGSVDFGWSTVSWIIMRSIITTLASLAVFPLLDMLSPGSVRIIGED